MKNILTVTLTTVILIVIFHTFLKWTSQRDTALMQSSESYEKCIKAKYGQSSIISDYANKVTCTN